ncbi:MAG: hypothetical protein H3C47_07110 [Candidatus Cloacimonetes bacterium]|nr:hypothetical protein [Candidatus Cloacimonadota bacterium]
MVAWIRLAVVLGLICSVFAVEDSLGFDDIVLIQQDNFLEEPIAVIEKRAEELTVEFSEEESRMLFGVVSEVNGLLEEATPLAFLNSDLQRKLLILERDWKQREGARLVVKLLEAVRIKAENYMQNALLLERLPEGSVEALETKERAARFFEGIRTSNQTLEETIRSASR